MSKERKILLILLVAALGLLVVDKFVLSGSSTSEPPKSSVGPARLGMPGSRPSSRSESKVPGDQAANLTALEGGYRPLPLHALKRGRSAASEAERNVFVYYEPPPPPPPVEPPKPPPPITIYSVNPSSVFARTKDFTLRVFGQQFPENAQIVVKGTNWLKTTRVSATELEATVDQRLIATAGQLPIEVKTATGELYSNPLFITVNEPPTPPYTYIGRIDHLVYLQRGPTERLLARLGQTVEERWRVAQVGNDAVVLQDVLLDIPYTIALEERGTQAASSSTVSTWPTPVGRTFPPRRPPVAAPGVNQSQPVEGNPVPVEEEEPR